MSELVGLLQNAVERSEFHAGSKLRVNAVELRSLYADGEKWRLYSVTKCPDDALNGLISGMEECLRDFVNHECGFMGYGVDHVGGVVTRRSVKDIALLLIRAGASLGTERPLCVFRGWLEKQSLHHRIVGLLNGVSVERTLGLAGGIEIRQASDLLQANPGVVRLRRSLDDWRVGQVEISIDVKVEPAFFRYDNELEYGEKGVTHSWAGGTLRLSLFHDFFDALSLSCNHCIRPSDVWMDMGDIVAFGDGSFSLPWRVFQMMETSPSTPLSQERLENAWECLVMRSNLQGQIASLDVSISRWMKSKQSESSLTDKFIELRVSLEALFLDNAQHELRFRLATQGAIYLGDSLEKREKFHKILLSAYDAGSTAVHGKEVDKSKRGLLKDAQDLCRMGILKILAEGTKPDWKKLVLGERGPGMS